jgi:hypothetical protein
MKQLDNLATLLLVVGGLNWGLVGLANLDLVAELTGTKDFGNKNAVGAVIYSLVGLSAAYRLVSWNGGRRRLQAA